MEASHALDKVDGVDSAAGLSAALVVKDQAMLERMRAVLASEGIMALTPAGPYMGDRVASGDSMASF